MINGRVIGVDNPVEKTVQIVAPVRYLRFYANGSTANSSTHFVELQALTASGTNRALNRGSAGAVTQYTGGSKEFVESNTTWQIVTNGTTDSSDYIGFASGGAGIQIDLGATYDDITTLKWWNYYADGRTYYSVSAYVSVDGSNWTTVYSPQNRATDANGISVAIPSSSSKATTGIWSNNEVYAFVKNNTWPGGRIPPITTNLLAVYDGDSWTGSQWSDIYGTYHATTVTGTISKVTSTVGNGSSKTFSTLQGSTSAGLRFPSGILPSTYTLFHVTRYTGGTRLRIVTGSNNNWLSGHWGGNAGVAYHEGWLTDQTDRHVNNWVLSTDQNSLYRSNGVTRGTSGGSASTALTINYGTYTEYSDWQCAFLAVYNGTMSSTDYQTMESWIKDKHGLTY